MIKFDPLKSELFDMEKAKTGKHYIYITVILLILGLSSFVMFQNCVINQGDFASVTEDFDNQIDMTIGSKKISSNVIKPATVSFTVPDSEEGGVFRWQVDYYSSRSEVISSAFKAPHLGEELEFSFNKNKLGRYKVIAIYDTVDGPIAYKKDLLLVDGLDAVLGYMCVSSMQRAQVPDITPGTASCHTGEVGYHIGIKMANEFDTTCRIEARYDGKIETLDESLCSSAGSELTVMVKNAVTNNKCKQARFRVYVSNIEEVYTVHYKITGADGDVPGFMLSTNSSWCTNSNGPNTVNPPVSGGGETCYVMGSGNCYTPKDSNVYTQCSDQFDKITVSTSCGQEYTMCSVYDCQSGSW